MAWQQQWPLILILFAVLIIYLVVTEFRRFLAIIGMCFVFQLTWESINTGTDFPYFSLTYMYNDIDLWVMDVSLTAIVLKSFIFSTGSYIVGSMAGRKFIDNKIDLVKNRGRRTVERMTIGVFSSIIYTLSMLAIEPVLAHGSLIGLGTYETFFSFPVYFGVDPRYFFGCIVTSAVNFVVIAMIESNIEYHPEEVMFNFEGEKQRSAKHHVVGLVVLNLGIFIPSILVVESLPEISVINLVIIIPAIYVTYFSIMTWSARANNSMVHDFCDGHPDSFLCDS
jgi:hypothetical protein